MKTQIRRKKWNWISHILRKPHNNVTKQALFWNPKGKQTVVGRQTTGEDQPNKSCSKQSYDGPKLDDKFRTESSGRKLWKTYLPLTTYMQEPRDYIYIVDVCPLVIKHYILMYVPFFVVFFLNMPVALLQQALVKPHPLHHHLWLHQQE